MSVWALLSNINQEDKTVPLARKRYPGKTLVTEIVAKMKLGGRLSSYWRETSRRLGIVDASECPPTFGVPSISDYCFAETPQPEP
jgi:N-acetylmuramic acid 6-phosphate etherase